MVICKYYVTMLIYIYIFIMKSCTKHTKKKIKYNRLDNHVIYSTFLAILKSPQCYRLAHFISSCPTAFRQQFDIISHTYVNTLIKLILFDSNDVRGVMHGQHYSV